MQQRLDSLLPEPITFAHRGARAHAPENTLAAFALARRLGATGLESDVWVTADGEAVLDHDGVVRIGRRRRPIGDVPKRALPEHIPTLAELVTSGDVGYHLSLDLKSEQAGPVVVATVREAAPELEGRLWLCHPDWRVVSALRSATNARLVDSTRLERIKEGPERRAATLRQHGIDAVNMHHTDWNGGLTTLFHRFGLFTLGWDMQHEPVLRAGIRMGLDGLFSDHVDRMVDVVLDETSRQAEHTDAAD